MSNLIQAIHKQYFSILSLLKKTYLDVSDQGKRISRNRKVDTLSVGNKYVTNEVGVPVITSKDLKSGASYLERTWQFDIDFTKIDL